jgi:dopamine beta-monooxygenase
MRSLLTSACLFATATAWTVTWSDTPANLLGIAQPGLTTHAFRPKADLQYNLTWGLTTDRIYVAVEAQTTGWVGFGLSEAGGMRGADIMMGHVDSSGIAYVGDYHATANQKPVYDGCQDWTVHHGEERDGSTMLVVSRKLTTEDSNDRPILLSGGLKTQGLLAAYGSDGDDDPATYSHHGANKYKYKLDLNSGTPGDQPSWSAAKLATADLSFFELKANEGTAGTPDGTDAGFAKTFVGPQAGGQLIPEARTTYNEYCFPADAAWGQTGKFMVAFEGIADGSPSNVHHFVLHGYDQDSCQKGAGERIVWVGGVNFYEDLPTDVGMSTARAQSYRLQVHYDNAAQPPAAGLRDNSGVRIWLSATTPVHQGATLQLGDGTLRLAESGAIIPTGRSFFQFSCPTIALPHDITVFGSILHMHQTGDQMYTELTNSAGVVTRPNSVEYFDFAFQDPTLVEPYTIRNGDSLTTRCYFKNQASTNISFGLGSEQEMCIDFLFYYPYNANIQEHCTLGFGGALGGTYDGSTAITSASDPGMRVFGTDVGTPDDPTCTGGATTTTGAGATTTAAPTAGAGATTTAAPTVGPGVDTSTDGGGRTSPGGAAASLLLALGTAAICGF